MKTEPQAAIQTETSAEPAGKDVLVHFSADDLAHIEAWSKTYCAQTGMRRLARVEAIRMMLRSAAPPKAPR